MFAHQIGRNVQVSVDDMLVKSLREDDHLDDLRETFDTFRSYNMKLNPNKCKFGVTAGKSFEWTDECQKAFEELKKYLSSPPLLSPSKPGEELYLYLVILQVAVNASLVREEDGCQRPVYFISRVFQGAKERYPQMEKLAFALVTAAPKFKAYFQAHIIIVLTDQPLRRAMSSPEAAGQMALWAIELSEFDI